MTPAELKSWRRERRLTQTQLATLLGVQYLAVSRWERAERQIPALLPLALKWLEEESRRQKVVKA